MRDALFTVWRHRHDVAQLAVRREQAAKALDALGSLVDGPVDERPFPARAKAIAARGTRKSDDEDSTISMLSAASKANSDQKRIIGILCRGFLGLSIAGAIGEKDAAMERIILDFCNRALARSVAGSPAKKIHVTYGAAHLPGFLKDLQALDPAMKIHSLRWVRPMSLPNEPQAPAGYPVTRQRKKKDEALT